MPGVVKVIRNGSFLGVIASREEQAFAAAAAMEKAARWDVKSVLPGTEGIYDWLLRAPIARNIEVKRQPRPGGSPAAAKVIEAMYYRPYHMHGSIGTSAAIAQLGADGVMTIHTHSQSVGPTAEAIAKMLGMDAKKVRCIHTQGSGCYGHNMADDAAADAALLAQALPGRPVKLQYTRAQEHQWEPYGSAMVVKTKAGVDAQGNVLDWDLELWSTPHGTRPGGDPGNLLSARYLETPFPQPTPGNGGAPNYSADRNAIALYEFPGHNVTTHFITEMPLRVSSTRGLGAYGNVFAIESFIDELATAAGADPVEYRLRFLKNPRARDVVTKAAETFGWGSYKKAANRGRGIAFAQYKNNSAYTAVALEVEVIPRTGRIRILKAVAANDSGHMVSPSGVANQIEGGVIQSLSWTLKEEVKFDNTSVLSRDWASYPIITFSEIPNVEVALIDRPGQPYLGTGESAQGPAGAALANAVFDAIGVRLRRVPFTPDRVLAAIQAKS
jgi:CO/xanthine dehydrogenase Mo-binding subunit